MHEFRMGFHLEDKVDSSEATGHETNFEWFSLGVKIYVAEYDKLTISTVGPWGFDVRSLFNNSGPVYFLQLAAPAEYYFTEYFKIRTVLRFNHAYERSDINISISKKAGNFITIEWGRINNLFLVKHGDHVERPEWNEFSHINLAVKGNIGKHISLDFGAL